MGPGNGGNVNKNFNAAPRPLNNYNSAPTPSYNVDPAQNANYGERLTVTPENTLERAPVPQNSEPLPQQPAPTAVPLPQITAVQSTTDSSSVPVDKEVDAEQLERVWVDKAKNTIERTKMDPHEEAHQIAELTAGYLRERYGKEIGK